LWICHTFSSLLPIICPCQQCRFEIYSTQMHFDEKRPVNIGSSTFNLGLKS
jgi:hypothetical protein